MRGCFYLIRLRREWARYFAFNVAYTAEELGVQERGNEGSAYYIGAQVIPMGWRCAVGLVQAIHKRLMCARDLPYPLSAQLPREREQRADKPLPLLSLRGEQHRRVWQVYIDDYDTMELVAMGTPMQTESPEWQLAARA
eukprot:4732541-Amphidinium_carterae.1